MTSCVGSFNVRKGSVLLKYIEFRKLDAWNLSSTQDLCGLGKPNNSVCLKGVIIYTL